MKNQKERFESKDLRIYQILNARSELADEDSAYLSYLEKGFKGEKKFMNGLQHFQITGFSLTIYCSNVTNPNSKLIRLVSTEKLSIYLK